jgi:hypothetical protein
MKKLNCGLRLGTSLNARAGLGRFYVVRVRLTIFLFPAVGCVSVTDSRASSGFRVQSRRQLD